MPTIRDERNNNAKMFAPLHARNGSNNNTIHQCRSHCIQFENKLNEDIPFQYVYAHKYTPIITIIIIIRSAQSVSELSSSFRNEMHIHMCLYVLLLLLFVAATFRIRSVSLFRISVQIHSVK